MSGTPGQRHGANTALSALRWSVLIQIRLAGAFLAILIAMGTSHAAAAEFDRDAVLTFIRDALEGDRVPGAAVAIIQSGNLVLLEGFGHDAKGRPVTPETGFRLGSMSKAFTALAVMGLVDSADIALDQRVVEVLPDFALADQSVADTLTLRHLLAHASGIPERAPRATPDASLRDHVEALADVAPVAEPGERHIYASPNYLIAARMLEVASGRLFEALVREEIFKPLAMGCSHVSAGEDTAGLLSAINTGSACRFPRTFERIGGGWPPPPSFPAPATWRSF